MIRCAQVKIGTKIKCISTSHHSYGKTGRVLNVSIGHLNFMLDEGGEEKVCYNGCFEILNNNYDLLNGGQKI
jgi:hypothetical protein